MEGGEGEERLDAPRSSSKAGTSFSRDCRAYSAQGVSDNEVARIRTMRTRLRGGMNRWSCVHWFVSFRFVEGFELF